MGLEWRATKHFLNFCLTSYKFVQVKLIVKYLENLAIYG